MSSIGNKINELQQKIQLLKNELSEINKNEEPLPEFIDKANLLRSNEYLQRSNDQKSKLIKSYEEYTVELEKIVSSILEIKGNLNSLKSRFQHKKKIAKKKRNSKPRKKIKRKTKLKSRRRKLRRRS